jgi:GMP synthase-like glutamine amidotransferase
MRILCLQHVPFEGPAAIADWAAAKGHSLVALPLFENAVLPSQSDYDRLVVMGGPMSVQDVDARPWLRDEKRFIGAAIASGKTVIGVCLGAQLIAEALGARVYRHHQKEIGWYPIALTDAGRRSDAFGFLPERLEVFHWHGDTFDLPPDSVHLARSEACENQAFLHRGRVLGLQFHLESKPGSVRDIVAHCSDEIEPASCVQSAERMLAAGRAVYQRINQALYGVLDRLPA